MYPRRVRESALLLIDAGWSLNAVSRHLDVSRSALRDWRDHGVEPRGSRTCFACSPGGRCLNGTAYSLLFGYYLGDGCISKLRRTYTLRVSCDRSYPGIVADVGQAIGAVHQGGRVCYVRAPEAIVVQNCWKHWPCLFPQHGPGRKHERELRLEDWQRALLQEHTVAFLQGLFRSDGCRTNNWATGMVGGVKKRYEYPRWEFVNHSPDILRWCTEALDRLEIPWRQSSWKCISVSTRPGVARLDELVGPKH